MLHNLIKRKTAATRSDSTAPAIVQDAVGRLPKLRDFVIKHFIIFALVFVIVIGLAAPIIGSTLAKLKVGNWGVVQTVQSSISLF